MDSLVAAEPLLAHLALVLVAVLAGAVYARGTRRPAGRRPWPAWRTALFFAGLIAALVALTSGIETLALDLFSVHMVQHMILTVVAAPLILLGQPVRPLVRGLPQGLRRRVVRPLAANRAARTVLHALRNPLVAVLIYVGGLYLWHLPQLYDAAVENEGLHVLEHTHFFLGALVFWSCVIDPEPFRAALPYPARIVYLLLAGAAQNTVLGGVISFSTRVFYEHYLGRTERYGLDTLTDQRIGGAVMWVPGDAIFLVAASFAFFQWLDAEEREQRRREQGTLRS